MSIRSLLVLLCLGLGTSLQHRRIGEAASGCTRPKAPLLQPGLQCGLRPGYSRGYRHESRPHQYDPRSPYSHYPQYPRNLPPRYQSQLPPQYYDRHRGFERRDHWRQEHRHQRPHVIRDGRDYRLRPHYERDGRYQQYRR